jgi:hypothetical protein
MKNITLKDDRGTSHTIEVPDDARDFITQIYTLHGVECTRIYFKTKDGGKKYMETYILIKND